MEGRDRWQKGVRRPGRQRGQRLVTRLVVVRLHPSLQGSFIIPAKNGS